MGYYMGIDLGTSSVKIVLLNHNLDIVDSVSGEYNLNYPQPGWVEQNPEKWLKKINKSMKKIISSNNLYSKKLAIGVTGQMHGVVPLNKKGDIIYPCIIWADRRTESEIKYIKNQLNSEDIDRLSNPVVDGFSAPKILWLKNNRDKLRGKLEKILLPKDYIIYKLTGEYITDESDASGTLLFNIKKRKWDKKVLNKLEISQQLLPEVNEPGTKAGYLKTSIREKLKLENEVPVIVAGGDAPMAAIANNITTPGKISICLGTAGQILTSLDKYKIDSKLRLHTLCHGVPDKWYMMGAIKAAGFCLQWWHRTVNGNNNISIENLLKNAYKTSKPGANGLIFLPYLNNGERSPYMNPLAAGNLFGLQGEHKKGDITRAILEGVAFAFRQNLEIMKKHNIKTDKIYITGGGSKSSYWCKIIASILKQPVFSFENTRSSAYGAALSAVSMVTNKDYLNSSLDIKENLQKYKPDKNAGSIYDKSYKIFKKLYQSNQELFIELSRLR
ncbi:MAG: xylulokinase [Bacillota bacterium]